MWLMYGLPRPSRTSVGAAHVGECLAAYHQMSGWYPSHLTESGFQEKFMKDRLHLAPVDPALDVYFVTATKGPAAGRKKYFRYEYRGSNTAPLLHPGYWDGTNFSPAGNSLNVPP